MPPRVCQPASQSLAPSFPAAAGQAGTLSLSGRAGSSQGVGYRRLRRGMRLRLRLRLPAVVGASAAAGQGRAVLPCVLLSRGARRRPPPPSTSTQNVMQARSDCVRGPSLAPIATIGLVCLRAVHPLFADIGCNHAFALYSIDDGVDCCVRPLSSSSAACFTSIRPLDFTREWQQNVSCTAFAAPSAVS